MLVLDRCGLDPARTQFHRSLWELELPRHHARTPEDRGGRLGWRGGSGRHRHNHPGQLLRMPPVLSLGGTRRGQALLGLQQPVQDQQPAHQLVQGVAGDPSGWLAALARSAWASVCSSRPIRFGFILAPRHPVPYAPAAAVESDLEMPEGRPPSVARASGCEAHAGPCVAELAGARRARAMGVCSTGCALRLISAAHAAAPSFHPGPRGAASLGGLSPASPSSPAPPNSLGRGRSMARALDLERANAVRDRYVEVTTVGDGSSGRSPREVPSICGATVGGEGARRQTSTAWRPRLDGGSALNLGSAPWPG
jgi:hypothetical protein